VRVYLKKPLSIYPFTHHHNTYDPSGLACLLACLSPNNQEKKKKKKRKVRVLFYIVLYHIPIYIYIYIYILFAMAVTMSLVEELRAGLRGGSRVYLPGEEGYKAGVRRWSEYSEKNAVSFY
jgi:hypothetical protein